MPIPFTEYGDNLAIGKQMGCSVEMWWRRWGVGEEMKLVAFMAGMCYGEIHMRRYSSVGESPESMQNAGSWAASLISL